MNDLTMTNVWLAILAIVSLLEFLMIAAVGVFAYKMYKEMMGAIENVERVHIAPLRARVDAILDEVEAITAKVKHAQESMAHVFQAAAGAGTLLAFAVKSKSWPVLGLINGVRTAANIMFKNGKDEPDSMSGRSA